MALTDEQLKLRLTGIGGSEIAGICGLNPYSSPLDVYLTKVEGKRFEGNEHTERGEFLEPAIAAWYAKRTGFKLREVGTIVHPSFSGVLCTPDRLALTPEAGEIDVSIKAPGARTEHHWGTPGSDEVPTPYLLQAQWELLTLEPLYGITRAEVVPMLGGVIEVFHVPKDGELQGYLLEEAQKFLTDYVRPKKPPPLDGSDACSQWIARRFPKERIASLQADAQIEEWAGEYHRVEKALKDAMAERNRLENLIKDRLGDSEGVEGRFGRILWRKSKDGLSTDWKAIVAAAQVPGDIIKKFQRPTEGARRFTTKWSDEQ